MTSEKKTAKKGNFELSAEKSPVEILGAVTKMGADIRQGRLSPLEICFTSSATAMSVKNLNVLDTRQGSVVIGGD